MGRQKNGGITYKTEGGDPQETKLSYFKMFLKLILVLDYHANVAVFVMKHCKNVQEVIKKICIDQKLGNITTH